MVTKRAKNTKKTKKTKLGRKPLARAKALKSLKKNRHLFYSLGLGFILLGYFVPFGNINNDSPATEAISNQNNVNTSQSPLSTRDSKGPSAYKRTTNSLSPKNKAAFHSLSSSDKKRVVDASQKGKGHKELHKVLKEDQKNYDQNKKNQTDTGDKSPASKAIEKHMNNVQSTQQENIYE